MDDEKGSIYQRRRSTYRLICFSAEHVCFSWRHCLTIVGKQGNQRFSPKKTLRKMINFVLKIKPKEYPRMHSIIEVNESQESEGCWNRILHRWHQWQQPSNVPVCGTGWSTSRSHSLEQCCVSYITSHLLNHIESIGFCWYRMQYETNQHTFVYMAFQCIPCIYVVQQIVHF